MKEIKKINLFSKNFFVNFENGLVSIDTNGVSCVLVNKFIYNIPLNYINNDSIKIYCGCGAILKC